MGDTERVGIRVRGIVQGVGFRPFVHALASRSQLAGLVGNDGAGVFIEVEGPPAAVERFCEGLVREAPPLAVIESIERRPLEATGATGFRIVESEQAGSRQTLVSPDTATCADCMRELLDPDDRRYRYPFINCTNCGPRFTIIRDVPYDRPATTMARFAMCDRCAREYHDPADRRFHAQPTCCPTCGPALSLVDATGRSLGEDPLAGAVARLRAGEVLAIKGLGGYHLAALAASDGAVDALRARKHREDKPFAVMAADLQAARALVHVGDEAAEILSSPRRPIALLPKRQRVPLAAAVAPGNRMLGVMLPYTPLHHLLARGLGEPFVLTSGNVSDEPIAYADDDARQRLAGIADAFLVHDREIHIRTDDSVVRIFRGREAPVRRARGYAPQPVVVAEPFLRPVLAVGAELKNTFCLGKDRYAFVSQHIGDLENLETMRSFTEGIEHSMRLFDVAPAVVAHDLHPEYLSTKHAMTLDLPRVPVQHHHAHIASCLADNDEDGPVIGIAFDGLGYGTDGTMWGGEILIAGLEEFTRAGHLSTVPMPGGAAAIKQPWRMAAAHLDAANIDPTGLDVHARNRARWDDVLAAARAGVNAPLTSSMGRLFDAVAALVGLRDEINYEGQAAIELEQAAALEAGGAYEVVLEGTEPFAIRCAPVIGRVVDDLRAQAPVPTIAARFHETVVAMIVSSAERVRARAGLTTVALSGGVFQNVWVLEHAEAALCELGFRVLVHRRVPANDGGISLGQAAVAGARDRSASV